ncbi:spermidine putrescine ABC transporter binding protein [Paucilactobacillus vaccinostercus DSM 20634]|uniref:Spermidine putrescine ABC transporter binding protein n=1 Tax=Paucilactobacillus vaccinostercus DSM 20634 TaxID=1423813 RepID=A0A0R2A4X6_9LACO|nr:ABC transporter substrate-binding protein [Paucilactobacillus vaccinostercus]KRM61573.1 spermidine putrescine ABC transporter binding protein [Paucilactobacillus vaccinostercus DSM 20634]
MKKLTLIITAILIFCGVLFGINHELNAKTSADGQRVLNIYNWGDYIDPALIKKFEHQTGYHVVYETFDSNEAMLTKIKQGGTSYDLAVPSDYTVQRMRKAHLLVKLDKRRLPLLKNIDQRFMNLTFDPGNDYSVPYFWGTLGIVYNDQMVKASQVQHWSQLWNPQFKNQIMLTDSARDMLAIALIPLGYSVNTTNKTQLDQAAKRLDQLAPNTKAVVADEIKMYMEQDEAAVAVTYSGEAAEMMANNTHLHYVVPSEGSNMWFDNWVIPKTAKHRKAAYAFLNFMLEPKNAAQNAEYIGYSTPNKAAMKDLPASVRNDAQFYPSRETVTHLQVYKDLPLKTIGDYNDLFLEFKMFKK